VVLTVLQNPHEIYLRRNDLVSYETDGENVLRFISKELGTRSEPFEEDVKHQEESIKKLSEKIHTMLDNLISQCQ
jgi:hypothetical protein